MEPDFRAAVKAELDALPYQPSADRAFHLVAAMLRVLTNRLGPGFASEVKAEIIARADRRASGDDDRDRADAPLIREIADDPAWEELEQIISRPD